MVEKLVSVITPSFNSARFIAETIDCVQNQSYSNWEMLIVDDFSDDNSVALIKEYMEKDSRIKLIELNANLGAAVARNEALRIAKGKYVAFLDADDLWENTKLEKQIGFMQENGYSFTFSAYTAMDESGEALCKDLTFPDKVSYKDLLKTCSVGCLTVILDKEKLGRIEMPPLKRGQDYVLWLNLLKEIEWAYCYPESLAKYRILDNSLSRNKFKKLKSQWGIYRSLMGINLFKSFYYVIHYIYFGLKKNR